MKKNALQLSIMSIRKMKPKRRRLLSLISKILKPRLRTWQLRNRLWNMRKKPQNTNITSSKNCKRMRKLKHHIVWGKCKAVLMILRGRQRPWNFRRTQMQLSNMKRHKRRKRQHPSIYVRWNHRLRNSRKRPRLLNIKRKPQTTSINH